MKLKLDEKGNAILIEGHPVYVLDDGTDAPFDVPELYGKYLKDGKRNADLQKEMEGLNAKLKTFEGIEDPTAAKAAIEMVKNIETGQLIAAGKVEEIKAGARKAVEEQIANAAKAHAAELEKLKADAAKYKSNWHNVTLDNAFNGSKYIKEQIAIPIDMVRAKFGTRFSVDEETGNVVAVDTTGKPIQSRTRFGEPAEFEEAISLIVAEYPNKDDILNGTRSRGDGARPNNGQGPTGKTITRAAFAALSPIEQMKTAGTMTVVD
jgi:hypothetical protein